MSISPVKRLILETMWVMDRPAKPMEIAKGTGVKFSAVMMHLIGLAKEHYVETPEKGLYALADKGRRTLGLPEIDRGKAAEILKYLPAEKSFHFYADIGKPLNIYATGLSDFHDKIQKIDISSIEFHVDRGDFEAWFTALGDMELARKILLVREHKVAGEDLRNRLLEITRKRYDELDKIRGT